MTNEEDDTMMPSDHQEVRLFLPPHLAEQFQLACKTYHLPMTRLILAVLEAYGTKGAIFRQAERKNLERLNGGTGR